MKQSDCTILYYTSNTIPSHFMKNTQEVLLKAVGDTPIVCVSFKPTVIGNNCTNIVLEGAKRSAYQLYKQILIAAKEAKTEFVATAEDDMLYHPSHFDYRPKGDVFAYNVNKWSIFSWVNPPIFSYRRRKLMSSLVVRREALIKTLEERYNKYNFEDSERLIKYWGEPGRFETRLDLTTIESEEYESEFPNVMFSTAEALGYKSLGSRKAHSGTRTDEIPYWGKAGAVLKYYNNK